MKKMGSHMLHGAARALLALLIALFGLCAAVFAFVGFVPIGHGGPDTRYGSLTGDITFELIFAMRLGVSHLTGRFLLYGFAIGCCLIAVMFFFQLYRIVVSAERGDPFTIGNAARLRSMGWMLLVPVALAAVPRIVLQALPDGGTIMGMSFFVLGSLVLLILAGVFRHGAAMRADLEGTV